MEDRLKKILGYVVEDAIHTGEPVGSQHLVDAYGLDVSPATVRNWFAELEELGFITQTHTSSGRVPTEKGYKLYVEELMGKRPLGKKDVQALEICWNESDADRRLKAAAKQAAAIMDNAAVLGLREADSYYTGLSYLFNQPEFKDWNQVLDLSGILDRLDDVLLRLRNQRFIEPRLFIGSECPFGNACSAALITLRDGVLFGLIGPMRMDYRQAVALLNAIRSKENV